MIENVELVGNVYFDTNILVKLPLTAPSTDFLNLKDLCDDFGSDMFISDLVLKEYINHQQHEVIVGFSSIRNYVDTINKRVTSEIKFDLPDEKVLIKETETLMSKKIVDLGIKVMERKSVSYDKIEEIALKEISPWKNKGNKKSVRDTLILLSVLEHAKDSNYMNIFITEDDDFIKKGFDALIKSYNVKMKIARSLTEAESIVKESLTVVKKALRELRENQLKSFLATQSAQIIDFMRKKKYNSFSLAMGDLGQSGLIGTIEKINSIDYDSIHSARPPTEILDENGKRVKITFMVKLKFNVLLKNYYNFSDLGTQLGLEESEEESSPFQSALALALAERIREGSPLKVPVSETQDIFRNISVEATIFAKKKGATYEYSDLEFVNVIA